ncbi:MAG: baseplate assembly protein W [Desulfobacterales bacterium]|nr:baseplate assembly protein W [Desulfobacterales bacterium]
MYQSSIQKSVERILSTPVGTRVMRPEFGSSLFELIDRRADDAWLVDCVSYTFDAIDRWEPRISVQTVKPQIDGQTVKVAIEAVVKETGEGISMEVSL